ncbi:M24 family metallopeptidase [Brevibacillus sp. NRS-1366]|uniref:M24 family metallopeptidase n=1 Tax=Brevibacillus sp. NRS-1366 TaxID=3233899 RepID=UPI003D239590
MTGPVKNFTHNDYIHFDRNEFSERQARTIAAMEKQGVDGLLMFHQESMYYLTGYNTFGYCFFQCLYLGIDGKMTLLTRLPDRLQAQYTSIIEDIRIWVESPDARPTVQLREILREHGCEGKRLGVEWDAYGLTGRNARRLEDALHGFCNLEDSSDLVNMLRVVKSPSELIYVKRAAELADEALYAAAKATKPGAFEGDILADLQGAIYRGGGDDPANEVIIGSGPGALMCRYFTGRRHLDANDQLTLEWAGVYRHYHACLMRTFLVGKVDPRLKQMHSICVEALHAAEAALKPGRPIGEVFDAHARVLDAAGHREHRLNATGYSLGTAFAPKWIDWPMLYHGNPVVAVPGMVFFIHIIIFDDKNGLAMTLGRTSLVTATGAEPLSSASLDLIQK